LENLAIKVFSLLQIANNWKTFYKKSLPALANIYIIAGKSSERKKDGRVFLTPAIFARSCSNQILKVAVQSYSSSPFLPGVKEPKIKWKT